MYVKVQNAIDRALRQGDFAPESTSVGSITSTTTTTTTATAAEGNPPASVSDRPLAVGAYNQLIRRLGKADRLSDVFQLLDRMTVLGVEPNHETLEFATNAAVKEVQFETRAVSMKTLPTGE